MFPARYVRSLHRPADCVERAARLDHADTSAIARRRRTGVCFPSIRSSFISRRAFSCLFAISVSRNRVGGDRKLAARESAIQGAVPDVVWIAGVLLLPPPVDQQERCAELGLPRLPRLRLAGGLFLVGTPRSERHVAALRKFISGGNASKRASCCGSAQAWRCWLD